MMSTFFAIKPCIVMVVLFLLNVRLAVGNADFGDKGGVIRFHTDVAGYDACGGSDWEKVLDLLEDFIPRSFFDERVRGLRLGNRELLNCKACGIFCFYVGSGCPKLAKRRLDEDDEDDEDDHDEDDEDNEYSNDDYNTASPTPAPVTPAPVTRAPRKAPVTAPKRRSVPTRAPRTKRPTRTPTRRPTARPAAPTRALPTTRNTQCHSDDKCCEQLNEFEKKMGELQHQVGSSCSAWVASRDIFCAVDTDECKPTNVDLLGDKEVLEMPSTGAGTTPTEFCASHHVTFRAGTDFFLGYVTFVVRNASTNAVVLTTKYDQGPFYYLGVDANGNMASGTFATGSYTLEVRSDYAPNKAIVVPFRVNDC